MITVVRMTNETLKTGRNREVQENLPFFMCTVGPVIVSDSLDILEMLLPGVRIHRNVVQVHRWIPLVLH